MNLECIVRMRIGKSRSKDSCTFSRRSNTRSNTLPVVLAGDSPTRAVIKELARTAGIGTGIDVAGGVVTGEDVPESLSGLAAILIRLPAGTRNLLISNPRFAKWAMGTGAPRGGFGAKTGILTTLLVNEGPDVLAAAQQFDAVARAEGEAEPQRRTSIGPDAIPLPQWGRRPAAGGVGPPAPCPAGQSQRARAMKSL
jgi:hypothetical protein